MSIDINLEPNLSLVDIAQAQENGYSVMRSAHVGNARGYNLAVASMGIPVLLVDHNIVSQFPDEAGDKNYLPGSIITRQDITPLKIERVGGLAMRTEAVNPFSGDTQFIDQLHIASLKQAFPDTSFVTNTDYVRSQETVSGEITNIALTTMPELFTRSVEADGTVHKSRRSLAPLAQNYGILQLNDDPRSQKGVLIPNEVDIVTNFIIEAIRSGKDTQIHLSGPDMQHYTKDKAMRERLNKLYQSILSEASFGSELPRTITVRLVPADQARFVASRERVRTIVSMFDLLRFEKRAVTEPRTAFFKSDKSQDPAAKAEFLDDIKAREAKINSGLAEAAMEASEVFIGPKDAPFFSQYDLLNEGGLTMPAENAHLSMEELRLLTIKLRRLRGQPT